MSECEDVSGRLWRKMRKLEAKLVEGEFKPKGMRWKTFSRIQADMETVDEALDMELFVRCARFFGRYGMTLEDVLT